MKELVELEEEILTHKGKMLPDELLIRAKKDGFADRIWPDCWGLPKRNS
jgi:carbamoyl-phosphate synthase large subunit